MSTKTMQDINDGRISSCLLIGLGHTGCVVLQALHSLAGYKELDFLGIDTDAADIKALEQLKIPVMLLGNEAVAGHGTGGDREQALYILQDAEAEITRKISGYRMLVIVASLGGGTGAAADEILRIADEMMMPCVLMAVMPFSFESDERKTRAEELLSQMDVHCQAVVIVPNDKLLSKYCTSPVADAFGRAMEYLGKSAAAVASVYSSRNLFNVTPGLLGTLAGVDGSPRCQLVQISLDTPEDVMRVRELLKKEYIFAEEPLTETVDRAVSLLRVCPKCKEEEIEFVLREASCMLPEASVDVAACLDDEMSGYMCLTMLVHSITGDFETDIQAEEEAAPDAIILETTESPRRGRRKPGNSRQLEIPFEENILGIFAGDPPNDRNGINLDIPTFRREGTTIDKGT